MCEVWVQVPRYWDGERYRNQKRCGWPAAFIGKRYGEEREVKLCALHAKAAIEPQADLQD